MLEMSESPEIAVGTRVAVVMAGGSGERFWPLSRPERPKQLLRLTSDTQTMLEEAITRVDAVSTDGLVFVATSSSLAEAVRGSGAVAPDRILAEPTRRNTLGGVCWVLANLLARGLADASVAIVTSDHLIGSPERFRDTVTVALQTAEQEGGIVTIGIRPTRPETGYGYIETSAEGTAEVAGRAVLRSLRFREKPSAETAEEFVRAGNFLWNGGMFFFTVPAFMGELQAAQPDAHAATLAMAAALRAGDEREAIRQFESLPSISVDYAVMERAERVWVVPADFPWDDVGAWDALDRSFPADERGNVVRGEVVLIDVDGCVVVNDDPTAVVGVLGVQNVVVVNTPQGVLVCPKEQAQRVREVAVAAQAKAGAQGTK